MYSFSAPLESPKFAWHHHQSLDTYTIFFHGHLSNISSTNNKMSFGSFVTVCSLIAHKKPICTSSVAAFWKMKSDSQWTCIPRAIDLSSFVGRWYIAHQIGTWVSTYFACGGQNTCWKSTTSTSNTMGCRICNYYCQCYISHKYFAGILSACILATAGKIPTCKIQYGKVHMAKQMVCKVLRVKLNWCKPYDLQSTKHNYISHEMFCNCCIAFKNIILYVCSDQSA